MRAQHVWIVGIVAAALIAASVLALASGSGGEGAPAALDPHDFAWVRATPAPPSWSSLPLPGSPAALPVPPGWRAAHGDPGTRTAELTGAGGAIDGYLNATPQQGDETLEDWAEFRVDHNRDEEDRDVKLLASATGLAFPSGRGSCVLDSYLTSSDRRYREIACIVAGTAATTVVVAAAPPARWNAEQDELRRAITSFTT